MAEGLLRHMAGARFESASAGIHPAGLHPLAVEAMEEVGIDISGQKSRSVRELRHQEYDFVITVCDRARESRPVLPAGAAVLHWDITDPTAVHGDSAAGRRAFRRAREELAERIFHFIASERK
jgi:arsenate reductase